MLNRELYILGLLVVDQCDIRRLISIGEWLMV